VIICYSDKNRKIHQRWRDSDGERVEQDIEGFKPYFYIRATDKRPTMYVVKESFYNAGNDKWHNVTLKFPFEYENSDEVNLKGQALTKVYVNKPGDVPSARELFKETYEADIPFHYRYCVDEVSEIPEYKLRKWYWDMEWQVGGEYDGCITCIVVYDNYNEEYTTYVWFPKEANEVVKKIGVPNIYNSEKSMLEAFMVDIQEQDPDMMLAWFGTKFDLPKLIHRLYANGIDSRKLSPVNDIKGVTERGIGKIVDSYSPIEQPIRGRIVLNLDLAFERQWNDAQKGTLPSLALEYVAMTLFGEGKKKNSKFTDKNEFFSRGWLEDTQNYLEYALTDVELLVRIDEENFTSEAVLALQRVLAAPFDACFYASNMGSIYFMRHATWKAPTGIKKTICESCGKEVKVAKRCSSCKAFMGQQYEGAMIYDPMSEGTNGLHLGIAAFDFAGLYPSMMLARNISWETKSNEPTPFAVNLKTPRDFSECEEEDMRYYKTDNLGLLPKAVFKLNSLRDNYKAKMYEARENGDMHEYQKWNTNQMAIKRLRASFYGIVAYRGFGWYDVDVAASITASAREAIRKAAFKVRELE